LKGALGSLGNTIPALQPAAHKAIGVSTDLRARPRRVHQYIRAVDTLAVVLPIAVAATFLAALALTRHRRRTTIVTAVTVLVLMLIELIALKWAHREVLDQVRNPGNLGAVGFIYDTLVGLLRHMIYVVIGFTAILTAVLITAGPAGWAVRAREIIRIDRLMRTRPIVLWQHARIWFRRVEYYAWVVALLAVLIGLAAIDTVNNRAVINAALILVGLVSLLHIFATPPATYDTIPAPRAGSRTPHVSPARP
jgi:hypothetical protein